MKKGGRFDTATALADRIVEMLNKGVSPWHKSWNCGEFGFPKNWRGVEYRGFNVIMLGIMGYRNPFWLTYRKCAELGGQVRKGEKGCPVMYWHRSQYVEKDADGNPVLDEDGNERKRNAMLIRGYTVFNAEQCDGLPERFYPKDVEPKGKTHRPHKAAEELWSKYKDPPEVVHGAAGCSYSTTQDRIRMPDKKFFDNIEEYWAALFHEGCHSTGHEKRLARKMGNRFGSDPYAREELVAEIGAQLLCQRCGITRTLENTAAYCKGWAKAIKSMPDYGRAVVCAAASAQRAADWIMGNRFDKKESEASND